MYDVQKNLSKGDCLTEIIKLCLLNFHVYHQMPPLNWKERFYRTVTEKKKKKQKQYFGEKVQECKDGSGAY